MSTKKRIKVAIIGGGTIGLYLAWKLSQRKVNVFVFEKKQKIGKEVCSGLFSERILSFIPKAKSIIENQVDKVLIHFPKKDVEVKFSKSFFVMDHQKLDEILLNLAQKRGASVKLNTEVFPGDLYSFDRIIGCDGALSKTREYLELKKPFLRLGILGYVFEKDFSSLVETWAIEDGFLWKIPRGDKVEYGVISSPKKAKIFFEKFLEERKIRLKKIKSAFIAYPSHFLLPSHSFLTLCGESAGFTKPWSGGGVVWGLILADILLKNFPDFLKYQKEARKFFLRKIIPSKFITKLVYFIGFKIPFLLPKKIKIESDFLL